MNFDLNQVLEQMTAAMEQVVKDKWHLVKDTTAGFMRDHKERLEMMSSMRLNGEIDEAFFEERMNDEKAILQSELSAMAILSASIAEQAANAALHVLMKAVTAAVKI